MSKEIDKFFECLFEKDMMLKPSLSSSGLSWERFIDLRERDEDFKERWRKYECVRNEKAREQGNWCRSQIAGLLVQSLEGGDSRDNKASVLANSFLKSLSDELRESEKGSMGISLDMTSDYGESVAMENLSKIQEAAIRSKKIGTAIQAETLKMKATKVLNNNRTDEVVHKIDLGALRGFIAKRREEMPVIEGEIIRKIEVKND